MGLYRDLLLLTGLLLVLGGGAVATGTIDLPGSETIQIPGDSTNEPRYVLSTSITIQGRTADAVLQTETFAYDTEKCGAFSCNSLSFTDNPLLVFGADNVEVFMVLENSEGVKVAEVNKFIGAVESGESTEVTQSFSNIKPGDYTLKYQLTGDDVLGLSYDQVETVEIRVPETIAGGS